MGRIELSRLFDVLLNRCAQILFLKGHGKGTFAKVFVRSNAVVLLCKSSGICIKRMKAAIFFEETSGWLPQLGSQRHFF